MPLAVIYVFVLAILGILRLIAAAWHGLFFILAEISLVMTVFWALVELWSTRRVRNGG